MNCITEINNLQTDNGGGLAILMPMYNLIEYNDNYAKTSPSLWQYYSDEPNNNITDSELFKLRSKLTDNS